MTKERENQGKFHHTNGKIHEEKGELKKAEDEYAAALAFDPDNDEYVKDYERVKELNSKQNK